MKGLLRCSSALPWLPFALIALLACGGSSGPSAPMEEISANFDPERVEPFLVAVSARVDSGFGEAEARALAAEILALEVGAELVRDLAVEHQGEEVSLRIHGVMDDVDAPDLYLLTSRSLATEIREELQALLD